MLLTNYPDRQVLLLLLDTGVCYLLLLLSPARLVHLAVFWWAIIFMSVSHIYRMYTDYNGYVLLLSNWSVRSSHWLVCVT